MYVWFQACECHAFDVPSPEAHYKAVCRSLVEEAVAIQGVREMDAGKERDRKKQIVSWDCDHLDHFLKKSRPFNLNDADQFLILVKVVTHIIMLQSGKECINVEHLPLKIRQCCIRDNKI